MTETLRHNLRVGSGSRLPGLKSREPAFLKLIRWHGTLSYAAIKGFKSIALAQKVFFTCRVLSEDDMSHPSDSSGFVSPLFLVLSMLHANDTLGKKDSVNLKPKEVFIGLYKKVKQSSKCCGTVGRAVASDTIYQRFASQLWQKCICQFYTIEKTKIKKKRPG